MTAIAPIVIGRGRVGSALARALGVTPVGRTRVDGRSTVVVLAVPDAEIAEAAARVAVNRRTVLLHCAGARDARVLKEARRRGASVGVIHPLVSFADRRRPPALAGTTFVIGGDRRARAAAKEIAKAVGAHALVAEIHGAAYHAAAALAANGAAALAARSVEVLRRLGVGRRDAERAIGALLATVADNVHRIGLPRALTGPIARGDAATVAAHRAALPPRAAALYEAIAPAILELARQSGLRPSQAAKVRRALQAR